jgi:hypothetical protein
MRTTVPARVSWPWFQPLLLAGMTRKEVEGYLQAKNVERYQMCCVDSREGGRRSWDDLVGEEFTRA